MTFAVVRNSQSFPLRSVPVHAPDRFRTEVLSAINNGARIAALFGARADDQAPIRIYIVMAQKDSGTLAVASFEVIGDKYLALTPDCPQAHWFEREIAEQWNIEPINHPWLKPIRFEESFRKEKLAEFPAPQIGITRFFSLAGEEVHEVAVGPVHAGIIEPGHFRFQCHGETVYHLEISLGYQHRGVEKALIGGPDKRSIHYTHTLAGDTSIGHGSAYCQTLEGLSNSEVPARALALRAIALELERIANHVGDLGALANDVGYLPTASFCGRIRGDFLNMTALICGSRFGRNLLCPGGVAFDIEPSRIEELLSRLKKGKRDFEVAVGLLWENPAVVDRFEKTGTVSQKISQEIGLVGPAARACGLGIDVRHDFPTRHYQQQGKPALSRGENGDVFGRAWVRWEEVQFSIKFIEDALSRLPAGEISSELKALESDSMVVSMVEGWRGEICHVALTNNNGKFSRYKVIDPSFHNWFGLSMSLRDQQISNFPLCNKSFNLSYCGHDL